MNRSKLKKVSQQVEKLRNLIKK